MARRQVRIVLARVADLSAATRAVLMENGSVTFHRGQHTFTLDAREMKGLRQLLETADPLSDLPTEPDPELESRFA